MKLAVQMTASLVFGAAFFGLALFWPAGTFHYWQAWVFLAIFFGSSIVPTTYLARRQPAALQRRLRAGPAAETRPAQRLIITAIVLLVAATYVTSALDHRFGWSTVPLAVIVAIVGVGGYLAYQKYFTSTAQTDNWKTYTNNKKI